MMSCSKLQMLVQGRSLNQVTIWQVAVMCLHISVCLWCKLDMTNQDLLYLLICSISCFVLWYCP